MQKFLYYTDFVMAPLVALALLCSLEWSFQALVFILVGMAFWTLMEYAIHRFAHTNKWVREAHAFHHRQPKVYNGPSGLYTPFIFAAVYGVMYLLFGALARPLLAGTLMGYAFYLYLHNVIHRGAVPGFMRQMSAHHIRHHMGKRRCYGVTTRFWDWFFTKP